MSVLSWLKQAFANTADRPPRYEPSLPPIGLERPDAPEMVAVPPLSAAMGGKSGVAEEQRLPTPRGTERQHVTAGAPAAAREREAPPATAAAGFGEAIDEDVYGLTFSIEYAAADGAMSRRRIMLRAITAREDGMVYLRALCFERNALRSFRLDRVCRIVDGDGVVHEDVAAFFRDELRVTIPAAGSHPPPMHAPKRDAATRVRADAAPAEAEKPGALQRRMARDGLRVLVALARSDGLLDEAEIEAVLDYIAATCAAAGAPCSADDRAALAPYIRRQRPGTDVLETALERLENEPAEAQEMLLEYAERVIVADGRSDGAELEMLSVIRASIASQAVRISRS